MTTLVLHCLWGRRSTVVEYRVVLIGGHGRGALWESVGAASLHCGNRWVRASTVVGALLWARLSRIERASRLAVSLRADRFALDLHTVLTLLELWKQLSSGLSTSHKIH